MDTLHANYRKGNRPDIRITIRQERPEAFYVDVDRDGCTTVHTWPAIGPASVSLVELLLRYRDEFGPGYDLVEPVTFSNAAS